jgi:hypothetical protein
VYCWQDQLTSAFSDIDARSELYTKSMLRLATTDHLPASQHVISEYPPQQVCLHCCCCLLICLQDLSVTVLLEYWRTMEGNYAAGSQAPPCTDARNILGADLLLPFQLGDTAMQKPATATAPEAAHLQPTGVIAATQEFTAALPAEVGDGTAAAAAARPVAGATTPSPPPPMLAVSEMPTDWQQQQHSSLLQEQPHVSDDHQQQTSHHHHQQQQQQGQ